MGMVMKGFTRVLQSDKEGNPDSHSPSRVARRSRDDKGVRLFGKGGRYGIRDCYGIRDLWCTYRAGCGVSRNLGRGLRGGVGVKGEEKFVLAAAFRC